MRRLNGRWHLAAIRPAGRPKGLWALPKGNIGRSEKPEETAVREVREETGVESAVAQKLGDVRYVYTQTWGSGRGTRIFKVVSFYLLRYGSGRLGDLPAATAHEVDEVKWLPLEDAPELLAYSGERDMARRALEALSS